MRKQSKGVLILGGVLFVLGMALGLVFAVANAWADLEASLFDPAVGADQALSSLRCPVLITPRESGIVSATFANPSGTSLRRTVRAHFSYGYATLMREEVEQFELDPGHSRQVTWTVTAEDAAWRHFVLVRVHELRNNPLPSRTGSCGVLVLNIPGMSGGTVVVLLWLAAVLAMAAGTILWVSGRRASPRYTPDLTWRMLLLGGLVLATMIVSSLGQWLPSGLLVIAILLILVTMVTTSLSHSSA